MTPHTETTSASQLVSLRATACRLDLSTRGLYRLIARGIFPRPVKVGGASKFFERDIQNYLASIDAQRSNPSSNCATV